MWITLRNLLYEVISHFKANLPSFHASSAYSCSFPPTRDIPMPLVSSGVEHGNLRELALARMKDMGTEVRLKGLSYWTKRHHVSLFWLWKLIDFSSWDVIQTGSAELWGWRLPTDKYWLTARIICIRCYDRVRWQIKKPAMYSLKLSEHIIGAPSLPRPPRLLNFCWKVEGSSSLKTPDQGAPNRLTSTTQKTPYQLPSKKTQDKKTPPNCSSENHYVVKSLL